MRLGPNLKEMKILEARRMDQWTGRLSFERMQLTSRPFPPLYSPWTMPVPAEVICRSPRFRVSTLPIESECLGTDYRAVLSVHSGLRRLLSATPVEHSLDGSINNIGKDFEFSMRVRRKALQRRNTVLVDHTQRSPALLALDWRVVRGEAESLFGNAKPKLRHQRSQLGCEQNIEIQLTWKDLSQP